MHIITYLSFVCVLTVVFCNLTDNATKMMTFLNQKAGEDRIKFDAGQVFLTENGASIASVQTGGSNTTYWAKDNNVNDIYSKSKAGADTDGWKWEDSTYIPLSESSRVATFIVVAELVRAGTLSLDDKIKNILDTKVFNPTPLNKDWDFDITIRHLLAETSGLETIYRKHSFSKLSQAPEKVTELLSELSDFKFMVPPGFTYNKSAVHWILLGAVIETKTNKSFVDATDEIFATLGLDCTFLAGSHRGSDAMWGPDGLVPVGWTWKNNSPVFVDFEFNNADSLAQAGILSRVAPMTNAMCTVKAIHRISELFGGQDDPATPHFDGPTRTNLFDVKKYTIVAENQVNGWAHTIGGLKQLSYIEPSIINSAVMPFPNWVFKVNIRGLQVFSSFAVTNVTLCDRSSSDFDATCDNSGFDTKPVFTVAMNSDNPSVETTIQRNFWLRDIGANKVISSAVTQVSLGENRVFDANFSYRSSMLLHADTEAAKDILLEQAKIMNYEERISMDRFGQRNVIQTVVDPVNGPFVIYESIADADDDPKKAYILVTSKKTFLTEERHMLVAVRTPTAAETKRGFKTPVAGCFVSSLGTTYYSTDVLPNIPESMVVMLFMVLAIVILIAAVICLTVWFFKNMDVKKNAQRDSFIIRVESKLARSFPTLSDMLEVHVMSGIEVILNWIGVLASIGGFVLSYQGTSNLEEIHPSDLGAKLSAVGAGVMIIALLFTFFKLAFFPQKVWWMWHVVVVLMVLIVGFSSYLLMNYGMFWSLEY